MARIPKFQEGCVVVDARNKQIRCEICKDYIPTSVIEGVEISEVAEILRGFEREHHNCEKKPRETFQKPNAPIWVDEAAPVPPEVFSKYIKKKIQRTNRVEEILKKRLDSKTTTR